MMCNEPHTGDVDVVVVRYNKPNDSDDYKQGNRGGDGILPVIPINLTSEANNNYNFKVISTSLFTIVLSVLDNYLI
jgi:hypothetical protein